MQRRASRSSRRCRSEAARRAKAAAALHGVAASGGGELKGVIEKLLLREDLSAAETEATLDAMLAGADATQAAAFLVLLRAKGETAAEVAGLARGTWVRAPRSGQSEDHTHVTTANACLR